ncbi:hypothetical protein HYALB_00000121 [Hymenoscyphus albidus]|uniref:Uncharacterized protein n=1 Tax=Hymenoscyphus albidus TaxID=595503 RepID=A0A9N9LG07_9HELO|nr:hypothetical protein HYALB_00000121 [Hymenoscyphus albidus]
MLYNILTIATLFSLVSATPVPEQMGDLPPLPKGPTDLPPLGRDYFWKVTNWQAECLPDSKCSYSANPQSQRKSRILQLTQPGFDISGVETQRGTNPTVPPFNAFCEAATRQGGPYAPCTVTDQPKYEGQRNVSASLLRQESIKDVLGVERLAVQASYQFEGLADARQSWNYTGNATAGFEEREFDILTNLFHLGPKLNP